MVKARFEVEASPEMKQSKTGLQTFHMNIFTPLCLDTVILLSRTPRVLFDRAKCDPGPGWDSFTLVLLCAACLSASPHSVHLSRALHHLTNSLFTQCLFSAGLTWHRGPVKMECRQYRREKSEENTTASEVLEYPTTAAFLLDTYKYALCTSVWCYVIGNVDYMTVDSGHLTGVTCHSCDYYHMPMS